MFFLGFSLFAHIAKDSNQLSKNASKRLPGSPQDSPNPVQDLPKTPKIIPRHLQDAPQTPLGAPKTHSRYTQDTPRVSQATQNPQMCLPGPIQSTIFERLGRQKLRCYIDFSKLTRQLTTQASKHPKWDGGMRGAFRRPDRREGTSVLDSNPRADK